MRPLNIFWLKGCRTLARNPEWKKKEIGKAAVPEAKPGLESAGQQFVTGQAQFFQLRG
jgi:hypothetical protein